VMHFVAPKFQAIFADFGVKVPPLSREVIALGNSPWVWLVVTTMYLVELALLLYVPLVYFGRLDGFDLPGFGCIDRRRHAATLLRALAAYVEGGRPLDDAVATLARYYPRWSIRTRLARVYGDLRDGHDWVASLRARGLIRSADATVLAAASR